RSFAALRNTDPGFRPEQALSIFVALPETQYASAAVVRGFDQEFLAKIRALPGVHIVGAASTLPLARMNWNQTILKEGRSMESPGKVPIAWRSVVMGDYFQALGIALKRGRYFTEADRLG